jgi:hypothetical protein
VQQLLALATCTQPAFAALERQGGGGAAAAGAEDTVTSIANLLTGGEASSASLFQLADDGGGGGGWLGPLLSLLGGFALAKTVVYWRVQFITAAMVRGLGGGQWVLCEGLSFCFWGCAAPRMRVTCARRLA